MSTTANATTHASRTRRVHGARRALTLACTLTALAASTASARPLDEYAYQSRTNPAPTTIVRITAPGGFDWADAGIGAAAGLAISVIAVGGALTVFRRRDHETPASIGAAH